MDVALTAELDAINAKFAAAITALEGVLSSDRPDTSELGKYRSGLARVAGERLRFLTGRLIPALATGPTPAHPAAARLLGDRVNMLFAQSTRHVGQWGSPQIVADWPGYAADTRALIADVRTFLATERREVYPLLTDLPRAA